MRAAKFTFIVLLLAPLAAWGQAICALPAVPAKAALSGTMTMPIDNCANTQQVSVNQLITFINANGSPNVGAATGTLSAGSGGTGAGGTLTGIPYANGSNPWMAASALNVANLFGCGGSSSLFPRGDGSCAAPTGTGSVTTMSIVTANGFSGSVQYANTTPAATLSTTISGPIKGVSGALAAQTWSDVAGLFAGTLSSSCFLNGGGSCSVPATGGGVTSFQAFSTVTTSTALSASACFVLVNASGGGVTVTLPSGTGIQHPCAVKRVDASANIVTVTTTGGQTIDGAGSQTIQYQYSGFVFNPDASGNWWVL